MEIWSYIEVLRTKKQGFIFKKDNTEERLIALSKIVEFGYPSAIQNLIPFLKDDDKAIQQATCNATIHLFKKIDSKKGYYDTLKHCDISKSDIETYESNFSKDQFTILLAIASLNGSGYVREKAIKKLSSVNSDIAIPFIVYRLADWVLAVRKAALAAIENFKKAEFIDSLVTNLPIFEWLQKVERVDLSDVHSDIMNFVVVENKNYVTLNFKKFDEKTRLIVAQQITKSEKLDLSDLALLLADKHFLVRGLALLHFDKFSETEISKLLSDKSASIRLQTLHRLKDNANFHDIIYPFTADNSASVREYARYSLKNQISDFSQLYNENLTLNKNVLGSLLGLGETNGKEHIDNITTFLGHKRVKIRKAAFTAIEKLDTERAYDFAYGNLDTEFIGLRNHLVEFLSHIPRQEVLEKSRQIYSNGQYELKKSMLKLFSKIGRWATIADIMLGTIDENENIRNLSVGYVKKWKAEATRHSVKPNAADLERANKIFKFAFEIHEEKKYLRQNPLSEIDFYLR
ncbi:MAG: HEAT repeat domain-containing protein [Bacteroidota bacterium]